MEKVSLYIKRLVDGVEEYFPNAGMPAIITTYEYNAQRMGSAPTIEAELHYHTCLDAEWTYDEYVEFNGEKFYVSQVPSSSKDNSNIYYKHNITFTSERVVLDNIYAYDVVTDSTDEQYADRYRSNMTSFSFYGTIEEFVARMNDSLVYSGVQTVSTDSDGNTTRDGFYIVVDDGVETDSLEVSFEDLKMSEALQEIYNVYELTFYWVGKVCHVGDAEHVLEDALEYGYGNALLSIEKENANVEMVDRVTGYGGSTNLQYYYPNESSAGTAIYTVSNIEESDVESVDLSTIIKYKSGFYDTTFTYYKLTNAPETLSSLKNNFDLYDSFGNSITDTVMTLDVEVPSTGVTVTNTTWMSAKIPAGTSAVLTLSSLSFSTESEYYASADAQFMTLSVALLPWSTTVPNTVDLASSYIIASGDISSSVSAAISNMSEDYRLVFYIEHTSAYDDHVIPGGLTYLPSWEVEVTLSVGLSYTYITDSESDVIVYGTDIDDYVSYDSSGITFADTDSITQATRAYYISGNSILYTDTNASSAAAITITDRQWITPASKLMPSIYRETLGAQRFYPAENSTYLLPDSTTEYYEFKNLYNADRPHEGITEDEDIYPTIKNVTNADGELIAEILDIAYDEDDSDALTDDSDEDDPEYIHSYFYIKLRVFDGDYGFNLFKQASYSEEAELVLTSGNCSACTFQIAVEKEENSDGTGYNFYNPVLTDSDGNLKKPTSYEPGDDDYFGDYILPISKKSSYTDRQQDTSANEVWIAVKKENSTFGIVMPNALNNYKPSAGDSFVLTGVALPQTYIDAAEAKLDEYLVQYMSENNEETFNYSVTFSRSWIATHETLAAQINENAQIPIKYNGETHYLYVSSYTCKADSNILYEITVELSDEITLSQSTLRTTVDGLKGSVTSIVQSEVEDATAGTTTTLTQTSSSTNSTEYLSKTTDDSAAGEIAFLKGLLVGKDGDYSISESGEAVLRALKLLGNLVSSDFDEANQTGFCIKNINGVSYVCCTDLRVWGKAIFNQLEVRKLSAVGGAIVLSPSCSTIFYVEEYSVDGEMVGWKCWYLADDNTMATQNNWQVGDQAKCQSFNLDSSAYDNTGNKDYWRCVIAVSSANECIYGDDGEALYDGQEFGWVVLSLTNSQASDYGSTYEGASQSGEDWQSIPSAGDVIVQFGHQVQDADNSDELNRMNVIIESAAETVPVRREYTGIYTFSLDGRCTAETGPAGWTIQSETFRWQSGSVTVPNYVNMGEWTDGSTAGQYSIWYYDGDTWRFDGYTYTDDDGNTVTVTETTETPSTSASGWVRLTYNSNLEASRVLVIEQSLGGQMYYDETETITLSVWDALRTTEYTSDYTFSVERDSGDDSGDAVWNAAFAANYDGGNTFTITFSDLNFVDGSRTTKFWVYATETESGESLEEEVLEY